MTKAELADLILAFWDGTCRRWDWDDFVSTSHKDPEVEKWRRILNEFDVRYPSKSPTEFCNADGRSEMLKIAKMLNGEQNP